MNNNIVYRISNVGECSRSLAASRLGNNPTPETEDDKTRLKYYSDLEEICAKKLINLGLQILPGEQSIECNKPGCVYEDGSRRKGIHVEIQTDLLDFVGHLDRRVQLKSGVYPVEIKCLGRFGWQKFVKDNFKSYPSYAMPEACYLEAEGKPGLYVCMNRDTGDLAKYVINDKKKEIKLDDFIDLELPVTFEKVIEKLTNIEIEVASGTMPKGDGNEQECSWCHFRYLCSTTDISEKKMAIVNVPAVLDAATMYKEGDYYFKMGKGMKDSASFALYEHAKQNTLEKFRVGGLSVNYHGQTTRKWYDAKVLEALVDKKILKKAERESAPYDNGRIVILKEKDEVEE